MHANTDPNGNIHLFFGIWIAFFLGNLAFNAIASPGLKRQARPYLYVLGSVVFLAGAFFLGLGLNPIMIVAVIAILAINVHSTRVCPDCGKTNYSGNLISAPQFCVRCGASLDGDPRNTDGKPDRPDLRRR